MKSLRLLLVICVALVLFETGDANFVSAQKRPRRSGKIAPKPVTKPVSTLPAPEKTTVATAPTITKIDFEGLKAVLKSNSDARRPLLVNFWATWCPPCREEFPELVKIDQEYRSQGLEFITVSLDDLAEIDRDVPAFLAEMKSSIPAYLLKTDDEETAIHSIAPEWRGALPLTVLYDIEGKPVFTRMGAVKPEILRSQIEKLLGQTSSNSNSVKRKKSDFELEYERILNLDNDKAFQIGVDEAKKDIVARKLIIKSFGLPLPGTFEQADDLWKEYKIEVYEFGCEVSNSLILYAEGYNDVSKSEIKKKFGDDALERVKGIEG